jgi:hypothetical protein
MLITKPMTLEATERLALLADALWSAFVADATLDRADLQYMLGQSGLTEGTPAADAAVGECDEGEPLLELNAEGIAVLRLAAGLKT